MKSLHDRRRFAAVIRILAGTTLAIFVWTVFSLIPTCPADDPECKVALAPQFDKNWIEDSTLNVYDVERGLVEKEEEIHGFEHALNNAVSVVKPFRPYGDTRFAAHAAGFSVIENAYWRNDTWYLITAKPWSFPSMSLVVSNAPDHKEKVFTDDSVVRVLSKKEAHDAGLDIDNAEDNDGTSVSLVVGGVKYPSDRSRAVDIQ